MITDAYPPSGIPRNYGVDFFIFSISYSYDPVFNPTGDPTLYLSAGTHDWRWDISPDFDNKLYQFIPYPSDAMIQYFDSLVGAADFCHDIAYTECMEYIFMLAAGSNGGPHLN